MLNLSLETNINSIPYLEYMNSNENDRFSKSKTDLERELLPKPQFHKAAYNYPGICPWIPKSKNDPGE